MDDKPIWQEAWRQECEAREWLRRFDEQKKLRGVAKANQWWITTIKDIERRRGIEAADTLRNNMNRIKNAVRSKG